MKSQTKFRSLKSLSKYLQKNSVDSFIFNNMGFTMDYYDNSGKVITYGNKSNQLTIECSTENRYSSRKDLNCEMYEMIVDLPINYFMEHITPAQIKNILN
jgi:hypothetical protein